MKDSHNRIVDSAVSRVKEDFTIVGVHRVHSWYAWSIIGVVLGMALAIVYLANENLRFESIYAHRDTLIESPEDRPFDVFDSDELNRHDTLGESEPPLLAETAAKNGLCNCNHKISYKIKCTATEKETGAEKTGYVSKTKSLFGNTTFYALEYVGASAADVLESSLKSLEDMLPVCPLTKTTGGESEGMCTSQPCSNQAERSAAEEADMVALTLNSKSSEKSFSCSVVEVAALEDKAWCD